MKTKVSLGMVWLLCAAALFSGCGGGVSAEATDPATMDRVKEDVHAVLQSYLTEASDSMTEDLFADGALPMYQITRVKKGDDSFDAYLTTVGVDPEAVEDFLHIQSLVIVKSDNIIVMRVNDLETAKAGLAEYHETQLKQWETYLPDQYQKAKDNVTDSYGDYLYYVTNDAQQQVVGAVRAALGQK